jgi:C4-type Zn-finger protein
MNEEKSENNNIGSDEGTIDSKMQCPICGTRMKHSGQLQMTNPRTGRKRMVQVHVCGRCGYRTLG